ncbi:MULTISPECIES: metal-dependent hydrolase family protein [Maribacter]|uniref:Amidohydrolase family protein n=1 Tax=Maribacter flavus TaxID=1658664 RepID=A0ABU7IHJ0_9FLAO|nr:MULTISPECIES: amidohydrolase family protein [Maribacter]MDC6404677.1 amidohydrolase family protein [Maribacter sp. PR66]MEE1972091.1 amidohydrolase family protein [Maribacter flavus]
MKNLLVFLMFLMVGLVSAQDTYLQCGKILDVTSGKLLEERTIVVSNGLIKSIRNGFVSGTNADQVVDLKSKTVLPGFIDMHVHIESESSPSRYLERFTKNEADVAFQSTIYAKKTLMAGFTTVRDLGGSGVNIALRNAINKGTIVGPRIFTAGKSIATTGGHADPTNGTRDDLMGDPGPKEGVVNSPEDGRKAVRQRYKNGADVIKITATGGVLSVAKNGQNPQFTVEEVRAITETAKDYGMLTAAHAHGDEGMQRAIKGGIKTIEHGTLMSEETMELMIQYDAYLVPTISAGQEAARLAKIPGYFPPVVAKKALEIGPYSEKTFAKAYKKGVPIAFGTDAGVSPHGDNGKEFGYMHRAGMPILETLQAATITNAKLLGMETLGQIKEGFIADIVAVNENPLQNVGALEDVVFVMKEGEIFKSVSE